MDWDVMDDIDERVHERGDDNAQCEFEDAECIKETPKALMVQLEGGTKRWLPKKAVRSASEVQALGDKGTLEIHPWFAKTWEEEAVPESPEPFKVEGCIVLQQSAKALLVKMPDSTEVWFPINQVDAASECRVDGDSGTLIVSDWIARQKNLK